MAMEIDRKKSHLESIIEHISEESTSVKNVHSASDLLPVVNFTHEQIHGLLGNSNSSTPFEENSNETKPISDSTSEEDAGNEKEDGNDTDESVIPVKISPRCDICGLLHFKSYRCLTRSSAPSYLSKAFDDNIQKLRVCRKCLTSKESCVENVAISSLASYSAQIRQMRIPLGMTSDRRTKAFEFVVRDLKHLKNGKRSYENGTAYPFDFYRKSSQSPSPTRKTLLQRFNVDDPVQKNLFLKELNLYSTDFMKNMTATEDDDMEENCERDLNTGDDSPAINHPRSSQPTTSERNINDKPVTNPVYHVAAKNVMATNAPEKKIGEMFDARKGMTHDLVVNTKRAWKPNKKYDDLRKVERPHMKKGMKQRGPKPGKPLTVKVKVDNGEKGDQPEKIRTCGINCAVCDKHVQKSYSCCTLQTAPEKFKHLFTPGVHRLKICRKCIPYKKVVKVENQVVKKKGGKINKKRGRKPKSEKPGPIVKALPLNFRREADAAKHGGSMMSGNLSARPFASIMHHNSKEMPINPSECVTDNDCNKVTSLKMDNYVEKMDVDTPIEPR